LRPAAIGVHVMKAAFIVIDASARTVSALLVSAVAICASLPAQSQVSTPVLPLQALGYCQLTSLDSAAKLSACAGGIPASANIAWIGVESQGIRYRDDGTAPTASVGFPIAAGGTLFYVGTLSAIELIQQNVAAIVDVLFYHSP
jgi:hypothetical protein